MAGSSEPFAFDHLGVAERLALIEQIWNSLPDEVDPQELPEWHRAEIAKRRAAAEAQPGMGKPWREVLDAFGKQKGA